MRELSRWKDADKLPRMEDDLRVRKLAGVVGELTRLTLTPSRRLQRFPFRAGVSAGRRLLLSVKCIAETIEIP
jgi:protein ImuA